MKKSPQKVVAIITTILFTFFISCQKDDSITNEVAVKQYETHSSKILKGRDAASAIAIYYDQIAKAKLGSNGMMLKADDAFVLDESEVLMVKNGKNGKINYTYRVKHSRDSETTFFNVVITEWGGLKKTMLFEYEMTPSFASKYNSDQVDFINFDGYLYVNTLNADEGFPCSDSPGGGAGIPISGGAGDSSGGNGSGGNSGGGGGSNNGDPNGNGNPHNEFLLQHLYTQLEMSLSYSAENAENNGGGNDGGGDDDDEWIEVSRSPRYLSVPPDDSTEPCGESEIIGIFNPVQLVTDVQLCNDLKAKSQDPTFTNLMNGLKSKAGTQNYESAYTMYETASQGLNFSSEFTGSANIANGGQVNLNTAQSSTQTSINTVGFIHCHLNNGNTFKIFSYSDIVALAKIVQSSTRPTSELAIYVTTASGTFAIKVNNRIGLKNKADLLDLASNANEKDFAKYIKINMSINDQVKGFLEFMKDRLSEISLFEQDSNGNWKKLELNSQGQVITTNC